MSKRSGGKESGEERQESEPALISVIFPFLLRSTEQSELPMVEKRERRENCQSIIFDEERLDPHGVGNLRWPNTVFARAFADVSLNAVH